MGDEATASPALVVDQPEAVAHGSKDDHEKRGLFGLPSAITLLDLAAAGYVLLTTIAVVTVVDQSRWTPKTALMLLALGPGLVSLIHLAATGVRAAQWALGYLGAAVVSALVSPNVAQALLGGYGVDRGVLFLAGYLAAWAIGRRVHREARPVLIGAAMVGLLLNAVLGVAQIVWGTALGRLGPMEGRAAGFAGNSVFLGGLLVGALLLTSALLAARWQTRPAPRFTVRTVGLLGCLALFAAAANLSGSRAPLFLGLIGSVVAVRRLPLVLVACVVAALALGMGASLIAATDASGTVRTGSAAGSGVAPRVLMWEAGLEATSERPILGWGPGRFRQATSARITPEFVRQEGQDRLFFDAHNLVVEQLTTNGVIGTALLTGFGVTAARRARGPLAWLAAGIALTWLLQPVAVATAPIALLALGAAARDDPPGVRRSAVVRVPAVATGLAGLVAATCLVIGTGHTAQAIKLDSATELDRAEDFLPPDAVLDSVRVLIAVAAVLDRETPETRAAVRRAAEGAAARDRERPEGWADLGWVELAWGDDRRAGEAFDEALKRNPWSERSLEGLRLARERTGRAADAREAVRKLCEIESTLCEP